MSLDPHVLLSSKPQAQVPRHLSWYCGVQAFLALDFVLLLPLGPDLASELGFNTGQLGWVSGAYSLGALVGGTACLTWLDRWPRRKALLLAFVCLGLIALIVPGVQGLTALLISRLLLGVVSAPVAALLVAAVLDQSSAAGRGRVMAKVMTGFTLAMVLGVPLAVWGAGLIGWRYLLMTVAVAQLLWWLLGFYLLPDFTQEKTHTLSTSLGAVLFNFWRRRAVRWALISQGLNSMATFMLVPSFSAYFLGNLAWPREDLASLYLLGGLTTYGALKLWGNGCDQFGPQKAFSMALVFWLIGLVPMVRPMVDAPGLSYSAGLSHALVLTICFCAFMAANACRHLSLSTYTCELPKTGERARYLSVEHSLQDAFAAIGAAMSSLILGFWISQETLFSPLAMAILASVAFACALLALLCLTLQPRSTPP